jgi:hypothetical protein
MGIFDIFKKNENILSISLGPLGSCTLFIADKATGQLTITTAPFKSVTLQASDLTNLQLEQKSLTNFTLHIFINDIKSHSLECPPVKYQELQEALLKIKNF